MGAFALSFEVRSLWKLGPARKCGMKGVCSPILGNSDPQHADSNQGPTSPELVSAALRDWCRIWGTHTAYIEPGSPWENPYIESFNGRLRDECLNTEDFADLLEAQVVLEDWRTA